MTLPFDIVRVKQFLHLIADLNWELMWTCFNVLYLIH